MLELRITYNATNAFSISRSLQDWWKLRSYDLMSASHYAASGEDTQGKSVQLAMMKALGPGKDWWIAEFQGGPFILGGRDTLYNGKQIILELNAALAHNMKGVIFYRWDPLLNGPEPWINAIIGVATYDTERRLTLKKGVTELQEYRDVLERGRSIAPSVGIYLRRDHAVHSSEMGYDLQQAMHGDYSTLSALEYEAAVLLDEFDPTTCTGVVEASDEYISECSAESMLVITWGVLGKSSAAGVGVLAASEGKQSMSNRIWIHLPIQAKNASMTAVVGLMRYRFQRGGRDRKRES